MSGLVQPGEDVKYVLGANVTSVSPYNRAFIYSETEGEVLLGTEDATNFAGMLFTVQISKSSQAPYNTTAYAGDNATLKKKGMVEAIAHGAIKYGQAVGLGPDGTLKPLPEFDGTPTVGQLMSAVGRAESACADGEVFIVRLFQK